VITVSSIRISGGSRFPQLDLVLRCFSSWLMLAVLSFCPQMLRPATPPVPKQVLLLLPFESSRPASMEIIEGLEKGLRKSYSTRVTVFVEFVRAAPSPSPDYADRLFQWISYKYANQHFDAICPVRPEAFGLAERLRDQLWPSVPIVFGMTKEEYKPDFGPKAGNTGVVLDLGDQEAVSAALHLLPETRHVALVSGAAPSDRAYQKYIAGLIHQSAPDIDIIPLIGLSIAQTASRVASLPARTIIYEGQFDYDAEGRYITSPELAATLAEKANSPIFSSATLAFGSGTVGGPMNSIELGGEGLGRLVAQVLSGTLATQLPVVNVPHLRAVDWRQLKKWNIPEDRLPPGTEVRFRKLSAWEEFRGPIVAVTGAILLQALVIGFLLSERRRRSRSERAASASEELSRAILKSLTVRIAILDGHGIIIRVSDNWGTSDRAEHRFPQAAIGANYLDSWRTWGKAPEAARSVTAAVSAVLEGRDSTQVADYPIRIGEHDHWKEVRVERLDRSEGGAVVTHVDITPQKQSELDRRQALEELHHMNRVASMGQLAGSLAHELAQPLASILSNAQAAARFADRLQPDWGEIREALHEIVDDDRRASSIIDRMRTILKKQIIPVQDLDLNRAVEEVERVMRNVFLMRRTQLRLNLVEGGAIVNGDSVSLQQVILNLLNNGIDAVQSLPDGQRLLTVTTGVRDGAGEILVDDNGPGISDLIKDRLFDSFFTTKREGLGMGLSICRSIVESLGGRLIAENREETGARFRVTLPLAQTVATPGDRAATATLPS
jgi:signal transduction histidine kinase